LENKTFGVEGQNPLNPPYQGEIDSSSPDKGRQGGVCSDKINSELMTIPEQIHQVLVYGIKEFLASIKQKKVVIGLSGGIDSAIVSTLLVDAIGRENVTAINMPSKFNSDTTKNIAKNLADNLGIKYIEFPIQNSVDVTKNEIENAL
jgi:NH3-dependent NAD+ synthetase